MAASYRPFRGGSMEVRRSVLFIITDDQERAEFNFLPEGRDEQGNPRSLSPNIDRLAAEGVIFLNQYVSSPVCTRSRYSVLRGNYASRSSSFADPAARGEQVNITWNSHIDQQTPNLARTLQRAGYFTGAVGKNHVIKEDRAGREPAPADDADPRAPEVAAYYAKKQRQQVEAVRACGFDYAASIYAGNIPGHTCKAMEFHNMDWITSGALGFLEEWRKTDKPKNRERWKTRSFSISTTTVSKTGRARCTKAASGRSTTSTRINCIMFTRIRSNAGTCTGKTRRKRASPL